MIDQSTVSTGAAPEKPGDVAGSRALPCSVAALYVQASGCYSDLPGVDPWPESRDARKYDGPFPVVAHPPCSRWCRLAGLVEARWGHKKGDDGGCFAAALAAVRKWGGVLEHPAHSDAFAAHGIPSPPAWGWQRTLDGGAVCYVEQGKYGHEARKGTWLYAYGCELPELKWGKMPEGSGLALVSACGNHTDPNDDRPRIMKRRASATPTEFRDMLIAMARSCPPNNEGQTTA